MKVAVVGSRTIDHINIETYLPLNTTEIVSGSAKGVDTLGKFFAQNHKLKYTEFLPEYNRYGKFAPIKRNYQIVDYADIVLAFWDGKSKGTKSVIDYCKKTNKRIEVILI